MEPDEVEINRKTADALLVLSLVSFFTFLLVTGGVGVLVWALFW